MARFIEQEKFKLIMKAKILIVDDEKECLHTIALSLKLKEYTTKTCTSAEEALKELVNSQSGNVPYDLLITDIQMPHMKGDELLDELNGLGISVPTLVMTGYGDKKLLIKLLRNGCTDYIDKPLSPKKLLDRVNNILQNTKKKNECQRHTENLAEIGSRAGEVAHDINNILCRTSGYADLVQLELSSENYLYNYMEQISNASSLMSELANQLLVLSRNEPVTFITLDVNKEVKNIVPLLQFFAGKKITLNLKLSSGIAKIQADRISLRRILLNLVLNARDAIPRSGNITITTENEAIQNRRPGNKSKLKQGPYVCLAVTDNGVGIDSEIIDKIFKPYFSTKRSSIGTGLGLNMVSRIMTEHKGGVDVYSRPKAGTTFRLYFPIVQTRKKRA